MSLPGGIEPTADQSNSAATRVESGGFRAKGCRHSGAVGECHPIDFTDAVAVADSVLYEGCRPYPHLVAPTARQVRRPVGVLSPRAWVDSRREAHAGVEVVSVRPEAWWNQTECLLEADLDARMEVRLRYLQFTDESAGGSHEDSPGPTGATVRREATVAFALEELVGSGIVVTVDGGDVVQARFLVSASTPTSPFEVYRITVRVENAVRLNAGDVGMSREGGSPPLSHLCTSPSRGRPRGVPVVDRPTGLGTYRRGILPERRLFPCARRALGHERGSAVSPDEPSRPSAPGRGPTTPGERAVKSANGVEGTEKGKYKTSMDYGAQVFHPAVHKVADRD